MACGAQCVISYVIHVLILQANDIFIDGLKIHKVTAESILAMRTYHAA